jgi:hypothetical protein
MGHNFDAALHLGKKSNKSDGVGDEDQVGSGPCFPNPEI